MSDRILIALPVTPAVMVVRYVEDYEEIPSTLSGKKRKRPATFRAEETEITTVEENLPGRGSVSNKFGQECQLASV